MSLDSMYPPPFPCTAETRPAFTRFGMIASMYFREMFCRSAISFRGTCLPELFSARSSIMRRAYLPLVDTR